MQCEYACSLETETTERADIKTCNIKYFLPSLAAQDYHFYVSEYFRLSSFPVSCHFSLSYSQPTAHLQSVYVHLS